MKIFQLLIFALALASAHPLAAADKLDGLLTDLGNSLAKNPGDGGSRQVNEYVAALRMQIAVGDYATAAALLAELRNAPGANTGRLAKVLSSIDAELQLRLTARLTATDILLDDIGKEFRAKVAAHAPPKDYDEMLQRLSRLAPPPSPYGANRNASAIELTRAFIARWQDYLSQTERGNPEMAAATLRDLTNAAVNLPLIPRSELLALEYDASARATAARDAKMAKFAPKIDALNKSLVEAVDSAKGAADLDAILAEINQLRGEDRYDVAGGPQPLRMRLEAMRRFALRWQEYLSLRDSATGSRGDDILRSLANDSDLDGVYPRSRLLNRLNRVPTLELTAPFPIVTPAELTFDTLDQMVAQLDSDSGLHRLYYLQKQPDPLGENWRLAAAAAQTARRILAAKRAFQSGNPEPAVRLLGEVGSGDEGGAYGPVLLQMGNGLALSALPGYLRIPSDLTPARQETVSAFLLRVLACANAAQDWPLAYRTLLLVRNNGRFAWGADLTDNLRGYGLFFAGLNQEKAGQFVEAFRSYQDSLRNAGPHLPREEIGRRIQAIRHAHPQEAELAETTSEALAIAPPNFSGAAPRLPPMRSEARQIIFTAPPGSEGTEIRSPLTPASAATP